MDKTRDDTDETSIVSDESSVEDLLPESSLEEDDDDNDLSREILRMVNAGVVKDDDEDDDDSEDSYVEEDNKRPVDDDYDSSESTIDLEQVLAETNMRFGWKHRDYVEDHDHDDNNNNKSCDTINKHRSSCASLTVATATLSSSLISLDFDQSDNNEQDEPEPQRHVRFGSVHERKFRMTLGRHPECKQGCPVELSWEHCRQSKHYESVAQHELRDSKKEGIRRISQERRNRIALKHHSTETILDVLQHMQQIRIARDASAHDDVDLELEQRGRSSNTKI